MIILITVGYKLQGVLGLSIASMICLFFTNNLFWLFSSKIRKVLLAK
jgi:formate hydrogenlyase subunit 3/multisubunit Na+/H+ antiporter MnhD subunit